MKPHHRRRRGLAIVGGLIAALVLLALAGSVSGGGRAIARRVTHRGFFAQVRHLTAPAARSVATERVAENAAINRTLAYTPYVRIAGRQHREIALTFDDGPGPYTPAILSTLNRMGVPATFFEVGVLERYFHDSTSEIVAHGYALGDHTELHAPMSHLSARDQRLQLLEDATALGAYGAPFPRLFRPPYGLWNHTTLKLLKRFRMLMVLWTVDTSDYLRLGVNAIVHVAVSGARPGAIILMHDGGGNRRETVEALPKIIHDLEARGYRLVTVPRLLLDNPAPADQQISAIVGTGG